MPNKTIGQLPLLPGPSGTNEFAIWNGSKTFRISLDTIKQYSISGITDNDIFVTGGTYDTLTSTINLYRNDGVIIPITGISTDDIYLTGGTYDDSLVTLTDNKGGIVQFNIDVTSNRWHVPSGTTLTVKNGFQSFIYGDLYVEGLLKLEDDSQLVVLNGDIILSGGSISGAGTTLLVDLPTFDTKTVSGSFDPNTGVATFLNNSGGTFTVSGFNGFDVYVTGGTYNQSTGIATFTNITGGTFNVSGFYTGSTEIFVTGGTYNSSNGIATFTNNTGGTFNVSGFLTGYTDFYTTGATLIGSTAYFDRTDTLSAYTLDLSGIDFTGNTSASCINDLWLSNLHGCSPITIHDSIQHNTSTASGLLSTAFGYQTTANGDYSHTEGVRTYSANYSHAEGYETSSTGFYSHSEGQNTTSNGSSAHAEGLFTQANGDASHAEGSNTTAIGQHSHSEGTYTTASGNRSHAEGNTTMAYGDDSHTEGGYTVTIGNRSHAEGNTTTAYGGASHSEGTYTTALGNSSHAEGTYTTASGEYSHASGIFTLASGYASHSEGQGTSALNSASHAEGYGTTASGEYSHSEGIQTTASGNYSHAGGSGTISVGLASFIHSTNSTVNGNRSVLLGGQNINAVGDDTVFVPNLSVSTGGTTSFINLDGRLTTQRLTITSGATNGYVLTSDSNGNSSWQAPFNTNLYNSDGTLTSSRTVTMNGNSLSFQSAVPGANIISLYGNGNSSTSRTYFEVAQRKNGYFASSVFFSTFSPDYNSSLWGSFYAGSAMLSSYHETPGSSGGVGNLYFDLSHYTGSITNKYFAWHAAPVLTARGLSTEMMRLHVNGDGDGYLGIGTKGVPKQRLHVSGNTLVNGTSVFSAKTNNIVTIVGSGSTSPIFKVQGSVGELFSVTDSLTGSLFSVNDISGLPVLEVFSDNTILMGSYQAPSLNTTVKKSLASGTNNIYSIPTSAYTGAFFDYTLIRSSGARAGNIMSIWSGSSVQYTDTSTNDIGSTTGVTFSVIISGSSAVLQGTASTSGWILKTIVRGI